VNPEFQRNAWLEMTPHRMVAAPAVLLALFALMYLIGGDAAIGLMSIVGYWVALGTGVLWGGRIASEAVLSEVQQGTWDQQRLSCIAPWAMTWGKLFGAPVFTWYVCAPCLVMLVLGAGARMPAGEGYVHAVLLVLIILFAHAVGLLASLHLVARVNRLGARVSAGLHMLGLLCAAPLILFSIGAFMAGPPDERVSWFGHEIRSLYFALASTAVFTAWAVAGCYRLMRAELQLRNAPWVWMAFVAFCMLYAAGIAHGDRHTVDALVTINGLDVTGASLVAAHLGALALGYLVLFAQPKDPVELRRVLAHLRAGAAAQVLETLPRWLFVVPFITATAVALIVLDSVAAVFCASTVAFFIRDAAVVALLNLGERRQRADMAAAFYLLVLYALAPALLDAAFDLQLSGWLLPAVTGGFLLGVAPAAVQAVALWGAVARRWRALQAAWR